MKKSEDLETESKVDYKSKDVESLFKNRQGEKVDLVQESVKDIQDMIINREKLHNEMMINLTEIDSFINNSMPDQGAASAEAIKIRQDLIKELLKKKIDIEELKVEEKLNFWRDLALLKKELREHMKEVRDMESKSTMLDNIMGI
jgi:hypothetical protein